MSSFAALGVSDAVRVALARRGITEPFAVQRLVLADVLAGRDVLVRSPTGSGKTLAFAIPIVERIAPSDSAPAALVLAPTRELVTQIAAELREIAQARGLRVTAVYGGVGLTEQSRKAARSHVIVATPGRLEDLLARRAFSLSKVRLLVLDEADRMLDMGFRPAVDRIVGACPRARQTLFFSATLDGETRRAAASCTRDPIRHEQGERGPSVIAAVDHRFLPVEREGRVEALVRELGAERDLALVFVRTKRGADRLVKRLGHHGVTAVAMHGDKSQRQREQALSRFEAGRVDTLVATDVAARGIDVAGISHVINFDAPGDREAYVHRVGRTGRAGEGGVGITFVSAEEHGEIAQMAVELGLEHGLGGRTHVSGTSRNQAPARRRRRSSRGSARVAGNGRAPR